MPNIKMPPFQNLKQIITQLTKRGKSEIKVPKSDSGINMNNERMEVVWEN